MPIIYDSDNEARRPHAKMFGRQRPIHDLLGGGKVANVLLWKDVRVSAALSLGMTALWFLFEVAEYNFVTLFCHICITAMLVIFIWSMGAEFFNWKLPQIPRSMVDRSTFQEVALRLHARWNEALAKFLYIACGRDPPLFFVAVLFLYILSLIGNYFSFLNLLYLGFVCLQTVPLVYDRYENEVEYYAGRTIRQLKKMFQRLDSNVLNKIPRGPVKQRKVR